MVKKIAYRVRYWNKYNLNFLYMRFDDLGMPQEKREAKQQVFFEDIKAYLLERHCCYEI